MSRKSKGTWSTSSHTHLPAHDHLPKLERTATSQPMGRQWVYEPARASQSQPGPDNQGCALQSYSSCVSRPLVTQQTLTDTQEHHSTNPEASSQIQEICSEAGGRETTLLEKVQDREEKHGCDGKGSASSRPSYPVSCTGPRFSLLNLFVLFPHWACGETIWPDPAFRSLNPTSHLLQHQHLPAPPGPSTWRSDKSLALHMPKRSLILALKADQPPRPC